MMLQNYYKASYSKKLQPSLMLEHDLTLVRTALYSYPLIREDVSMVIFLAIKAFAWAKPLSLSRGFHKVSLWRFHHSLCVIQRCRGRLAQSQTPDVPMFVNTVFARGAEDYHSSCRSLLGDP